MKSLRRTIGLGLATLLTSGVAWAQQGQPGQQQNKQDPQRQNQPMDKDQGQNKDQGLNRGQGLDKEGLRVGTTISLPETLKVKGTDGDEVVLRDKFEKDQVTAIEIIPLQTLMAEASKAKDEWFKEKKQSALPAELREFQSAYQRLKGKDVTWILIAECAPGQANLENTDKENKIDTFLDEQGLDDVTVLIDEGRVVRQSFQLDRGIAKADHQGHLGQGQGQYGQDKGQYGQNQGAKPGMAGAQDSREAVAFVTKSTADDTATVAFVECVQPGMEHRNFLAQSLEQVIAGQAVTNPYGATSVPAGAPREGRDLPGQGQPDKGLGDDQGIDKDMPDKDRNESGSEQPHTPR